MSAAFKGRHFVPDLILLFMRWYCPVRLELPGPRGDDGRRGVSVDHTTIYRWIQHYAPELDRRVQWCRDRNSGSWYVDETYVKVRGEWMYLHRAIGD